VTQPNFLVGQIAVVFAVAVGGLWFATQWAAWRLSCLTRRAVAVRVGRRMRIQNGRDQPWQVAIGKIEDGLDGGVPWSVEPYGVLVR